MSEVKHAMHNASAANYWMECSLYYHFKKSATAEEWDRPSEAAHRGTLQHTVSEDALPRCMKGGSINAHVKASMKKKRIKLTKEEEENVCIAMRAALDLITEDMDVEVEVAVELSHEPGSNGYVDVCGYCEDFVLIADYKFGQTPASPNSPQLKIYAANLLVYLRKQGIKFDSESRVKLAIIQPVLHKEALVRVYTAGELIKFQSYVEGIVYAQVDGHDRRGAGSLSTCEWCPAKTDCFHRNNLVLSMLNDLSQKEGMSDHVIEEIVRSKSAFKKVIDECVALVVDDVKRFPNWTRVVIANARRWNPLITDALKRLKAKKGQDLVVLRSPKQILDNNPELENLIDSLTLDQSTHVRLRSGAPKSGVSKTEPTKRPKANSPSAKKKSAKKAARRKSR